MSGESSYDCGLDEACLDEVGHVKAGSHPEHRLGPGPCLTGPEGEEGPPGRCCTGVPMDENISESGYCCAKPSGQELDEAMREALPAPEMGFITLGIGWPNGDTESRTWRYSGSEDSLRTLYELLQIMMKSTPLVVKTPEDAVGYVIYPTETEELENDESD